MATLLNTDVGVVEKTTEEMITGGRLDASLDQSKSIVYFKSEYSGQNSLINHYSSILGSKEKQGLEQYFGAACQEANNVFEKIVKNYPDWYASKFPSTAQ